MHGQVGMNMMGKKRREVDEILGKPQSDPGDEDKKIKSLRTKKVEFAPFDEKTYT